MSLRVGLLGCGQIGSAADETLGDDDPRVLTHARACQRSSDFELVALCDPDRSRAQEAADRRSLKDARVTDRIEELLEERLDVVVIAASTSAHIELATACIDSGVRLLVCEKPVGSTAEDVSALITHAESRGARVMVNFLRRHLSPIADGAAWVRAGGLGPLRSGVIRYPKGLLNWGSHGIDLLNWMLGTPEAVLFRGVVEDGRRDDRTQDVTLRYPDGSEVRLEGIDHREVTLFEMDLLGRDGRLVLDDLGRRVTRSKVEEDAGFPGYRTLRCGQGEAVDLEGAMAAAWDHVLDLARSPDMPPVCGLAEALDVHLVLEAVAKSERTGSLCALDEA